VVCPNQNAGGAIRDETIFYLLNPTLRSEEREKINYTGYILFKKEVTAVHKAVTSFLWESKTEKQFLRLSFGRACPEREEACPDLFSGEVSEKVKVGLDGSGCSLPVLPLEANEG
jgi:hypothetical protein